MKKIFVYLVFIFLCLRGFTQQDVLWSQYNFNGLSVNPAYAGSRGTLSSTLFVRKQWLGSRGSPFTQNIGIHTPLEQRRNAVGGMVTHDQIGVTHTTSANFIYAYMLPIQNVGTLSFGISGGITHFANAVNSLNLGDSEIDPAQAANDVSLVLPNVGAGVYFFDEKWYIGFSVPEIITNPLVRRSLASEFRSRQDRIYTMSGGMLLPVDIHLKFRPTFLGRFTTNPRIKDGVVTPRPGVLVQFDINASLIIDDRFWVGLGYRTSDAVVVNFGIQISDFFRIAYAYDLAVTPLIRTQTGSHELMIGFDLNRKFKQSGPLLHIDNPRYF